MWARMRSVVRRVLSYKIIRIQQINRKQSRTVYSSWYPSFDLVTSWGPPFIERLHLRFAFPPMWDASSDCWGLSAGRSGTRRITQALEWGSALKHWIGFVCVALVTWKDKWNPQRITNYSYLMSLIIAANCSGDDAWGEVETKRTKYSCCRSCPGRFEFTMYIFICLLYCFDRLPETSSHHKGSMITYSSSSLANLRRLFGILGTFGRLSAVVKKQK